MPRPSPLFCYFGCPKDDGPLHRFPNREYRHTERFNAWKLVLDAQTLERGDNYICNSLRLCNNHFEDCYKLPSRRLTPNAIPTLNLVRKTGQGSVLSKSVDLSTIQIEQFDNLLLPSLSSNPLAPSTTMTDQLLELEEVQHKSTSPNPIAPSTTMTDQLLELEEVQHKSTSPNPIGPVLLPKNKTKPKTVIKLEERLYKLRLKFKEQKKQIKVARKLSTTKTFLKTVEKMPPTPQIFVKLQLKYKKKPRGRRFSIKEKIMALTIYKQSPKAYKLLKAMFILPSKRCLQNLLSSLVMKPGIDSNFLHKLKKDIEKLPQEKRMVNLLFDEVSLAAAVVFNEALNEIIGFEDNGFKKTQLIADHALVFMIKGIKTKTKQPICFTFCKGATKSEDLKNLLTILIKELHNIGLQVISTICDQHPTNVSVLKSLVAETNKRYMENGKSPTTCFEIGGYKIFPLFDTPHLLKGVRNNLLTKNAKFSQNGQEKVAKWEHLEKLLDVDVGDDEIRLVNKLTVNHVKKEKLKKMKVKLAAQVFSQRVSSALRFLARHKILPAECEHTADFLLIFDKLFDSFNGHSYQDCAKMYKSCIKRGSPHFQLWDDLLPVLESIKFQSVDRNGDGGKIRSESVPSIKNWIKNIKTFKEMFNHLSTNHNVTNLICRNFNQDPLENFFSNIRSNGLRNVNPNCEQFISAFKTLIVNNYNSPHSMNANCEQDFNNSIQSLKNLFLSNCDDSQNGDYACDVDFLLNLMTEIRNNDSLIHAESKKYVTGYVIKKSKSKIFKNCKNCLKDLCRSEVDLQSFNYEIDYTKKSLFHPNNEFIDLMNQIYYVIVAFLRHSPESKFLKNKIRFVLDCVCDFNLIKCEKHRGNLIDFILNLSMKLIIHSWCEGVNKILTGKITKFDENDPIKRQAFEYYNKRH